MSIPGASLLGQASSSSENTDAVSTERISSLLRAWSISSVGTGFFPADSEKQESSTHLIRHTKWLKKLNVFRD
jgi:hypothetical protein